MKSKIIYILFLLFICTNTFAQEMRIVSGVINDNDKEPIIGVTVLQKGNTSNGTLTDINGYYEIRVPLGSTLQFSYIGMQTSEMVVTTSNSKPVSQATINMMPDPQEDDSDRDDLVQLKATNPSREDQSLSPYFLVKSDSPKDAQMPLKKTDVTVNIAGVIADVCVKQIYINESKNTLEAIYVFPGSTRAAVYGMAMTIGERRIEARIKKKEQARQEYEQAKSEGKSTTLLEQHRPNVFQMNVANILPNDTIIVEMRYTELLENEKGQYEFVYPTVVGPRYSEGGEEWVSRSEAQSEKDKQPEFSIKTNIEAGMPIQKISSVSHSLAIESVSPDQAVILLSNPKDNEGNRDYILQYELQGGKVASGLLRYEHGDENFFLLMMQPPKKPTADQIPPREYVFIIDVSGSMHGFPINVSKELIRNITSGLRPIDRFNVMLFESSNAMLYKESVPATAENVKKALEVIDQQQGSGGTRLYPAIQNAMNFKETEGFSRTFIIATDGYVTVEKELFNYIRANLNKANLFPFGIGSSVNRYLIEGLANAGMGTPYIVTNLTQAETVGKQVIRDISQPVLTNISIDWDDFDVYDVEPIAIPDVFSERPILVYGKYRGTGKGEITVSGLAGNTTYEQKFDVTKAKPENTQALRYLWARNQIRYYDDYAQYYEGDTNGWVNSYGNHNRSTQQVEYVTNLGLKYNLLTQYTSFLAVDQEVRKPQVQEVPPVSSRSKQTSGSATKSSGSSSRSSSPQKVSAPNFQLKEDVAALEEVVVVGYGVYRKESLTSSVSNVSSSESLVSSSLSNALQGKVAGVEVSQTSGEPGDAAKIRIRGASSIVGNNDPLIILDGIPATAVEFSQINPSDIENISVLKDASAASVYGARAANGVIVVSSKKANKRLSVSLSSSFSAETPNKLPDMQSEYAQGRPINGSAVWNPANEAFSYGPEVNAIGAPTYDAYDIFKTGYSLKNYLTIAEKGEKHYQSLKLGNNTQHGFIPGSEFQENSIGLNLGRDRGKLTYDIDLGYKNTRGERLQRGYNMSGIMQGILLTPPTFDNTSRQAAGNVADNPYWTTNNNPFSDKNNHFKGGIKLKYIPMRHLTLSYQLSGDYQTAESTSALNQGSVYYPVGHVMNRDEDFNALYSRFLAEYNNSWGRFDLHVMGGHEYTNSKREIDRRDGYGLAQPGEYNIYTTDSIAHYNQLYKRHSNAAFGKANVMYRQMIALETGMRGEWSSIHNKALLAPSLGVAAYLNEMFYSEPFSLIKLYANISRADKETPLYLDPVYFNSAVYNLNDAAHHFESTEVIMDNLKPESVIHYEAGTNLRLLRNRLSIGASWYWKEGKNQLLPIQVSTSSVRLENSGTLKTHGFELELNGIIIHHRNFTWDSKITFSRERNKVTGLGGRELMLAGIESVAGSYAIEGQPLGVLYGTVYERNAEGQMIIGNDGFPVVSNQLQVIGDPNPDWRMNWIHSLSYKNFSFSMSFDFKKGGDMWNGTKNVMNYYGTSQYSADHRNTTNYIFPGVLSNGQVNNIPVNFYGNNLDENRWVRYGQYGVGEDAIEDASYIKLREISLGYSFKLRILNERSRINLSVFATNILLHTNYKGVDPETNLTGGSNGFGLDYFNTPGAQSVGVMLKWDF